MNGELSPTRTVSPCGDVLLRHGDGLTLRASSPIEGLEPSRYRAPVLVVAGERFTLTRVEGTPQKPVYCFQREQANLYERPGDEVEYDGARHLVERSARRRAAMAWMLAIPALPLMPLLGLLPEAWKQKLIFLGIDPSRASRASFVVEWMALGLLTIVYPFTGGFLTPAGAFVGGVLLLLGADILYRVSADADGRAPGMFGIVGETLRLVRVAWQAARRPSEFELDSPSSSEEAAPPERPQEPKPGG